MDQTLKQFRAAIQKALSSGNEDEFTSETRKRLARSPGWTSAKPHPDLGTNAKKPNVAK